MRGDRPYGRKVGQLGHSNGLEPFEAPRQCEGAAVARDGDWFIQIDAVTANAACGIFVNDYLSPARAVYAPVPGATPQLSRR